MALSKTTMTGLGISGSYLRIMSAQYVPDGKRFQVRVGIYLNEDHRRSTNSQPLDEFRTSFDCGLDFTSTDNPVKQAYDQLKSGFTEFSGAEDC